MLLSPKIRFALWLNLSFICFAALVGMVRHLSEAHGVDVFVISFWRNLFSIVVFLPWLLRSGLPAVRTNHHGRLLFRASLMVVSSTSIFFASVLLPLAEATALSFTTPLFTIVLAAVFLADRVSAQQVVAITVGLLGVAVILRPGGAVFSIHALWPLLSAATFAGVIVVSKTLTQRMTPEAIGFWLAAYMAPISLIPALVFWQWPTGIQFAWLVALGAAAALNMYFITRALRLGNASATAVWDFVRLPWVAAVGLIFFAQQPDMWMWVGAGIIFLAVFLATLSDARRAAQ